MYEDSEMALALLMVRGLEGVGHRHLAHFKPYALLHCPEEMRAYRFVYLTLLTAAQDKAYLWDIPSARVVEVVHGIQHTRFPKNSKGNPCVEDTMETDAGSSDGSAGDESLVDEQEHRHNKEVGVEENDHQQTSQVSLLLSTVLIVHLTFPYKAKQTFQLESSYLVVNP